MIPAPLVVVVVLKPDLQLNTCQPLTVPNPSVETAMIQTLFVLLLLEIGMTQMIQSPEQMAEWSSLFYQQSVELVQRLGMVNVAPLQTVIHHHPEPMTDASHRDSFQQTKVDQGLA